jgi:membrane-associated protein
MVDILLSSFLVYQYWLLFTVAIFAAFGFPLPATAILIAGGALYSQGYFDMVYLLMAGFMGCVAGDLLGYGLSYIYGKDIFKNIGLGRFIDLDKLIHTYGKSFTRHGVFWVFISRWLITGLWPTVNIIAWLTKMRPLFFSLTDIVGEAIYVLSCVAIGYSFGTQWEAILDIFESFSSMILSLTLLLVTLSFFWRHYKKKEA